MNVFGLLRVLILHLKRYGYDNLTEEQAKKQDKVNIERFIDLSKYHNLSAWKKTIWLQNTFPEIKSKYLGGAGVASWLPLRVVLQFSSLLRN